MAVLESLAWVTSWAVLVYPNTRSGETVGGTISTDAWYYLAMVPGPIAAVPAPFCFRIGVPMVARALPFTPESGFYIVTIGSLALAGAAWISIGQRIGLSTRALLLAAIAGASTQGWVGFFSNPYLTDASGVLGVTLVWLAWTADLFWLSLVLLLIGPLFRENVAPMGLLWLHGRQWKRALIAVAAAAAPLLVVHLLPGMPRTTNPMTVMFDDVLVRKPPVQIVGDIFASYHALWLMAILGVKFAGPSHRKLILWPATISLVVAAALSLVAVNTVRMFAFSLPFVMLAVAEFFEVLVRLESRLAYFLTIALVACSFSWFPTRPLGTALSDHRVFQFLFASIATVLVLACWRALHSALVTAPVDLTSC